MIKTRPLTAALHSLTLFTLSTEIAKAVETTDSSSSILLWPLLLFVAILVVFRKQLFNEATPEKNDLDHGKSEHQAVAEKVTPTTKTTKTSEPKSTSAKATKPKTAKTTKAKTAKAKTTTKAKKKTGTINLKDNSEQCQAGTSKGTRCKRTTTLEDAKITIDGITYELTVCKQHNNDALKPFADLIK